MTWLISDEARKHRAFREVWVAYILGGLYLLLGLYTEISEQNYSIRYPAVLSPFTIFASTTCKVSRFYEKLDMFILKKIDKKNTFYAAEDEIRPLWKYVSGA